MSSTAHDRPPSRLIDVDGITLHYVELGEGVPFVLLHGGLSSSAAWEPLIPELVDGFRVLLPDSRGHGHSTNPAGNLLSVLQEK